MNNLKDALRKVLNEINYAKIQPFKGNQLASFIRNDLPAIIIPLVQQTSFSHYSIKGHPGMGNWADIVWIELLNPQITKSVQSEIYPTYLFKYDGSGFYLSLQQGANKLPKSKLNELAHFKSELSNSIPEINHWNTGEIKLYSDSNTSIYEKTNLAAKYYDKNNLPNDEELVKDLIAMFSLYEKIAQYKPNQDQNIDLFESDFKVKPQISLPKPFLLLAGVSGTGKSRFVRKQAEQTGEYQLVAVRPDWHEPSDLLGYVSRLSGKAEYVVTDVLKFIVQAWQAVENAGFIANNEVRSTAEDLKKR